METKYDGNVRLISACKRPLPSIYIKHPKISAKVNRNNSIFTVSRSCFMMLFRFLSAASITTRYDLDRDIVVGRATSQEMFDHILRISTCEPKTTLKIRGSGAFTLRIKGFQKLSLEIMRREDFSRRSYLN